MSGQKEIVVFDVCNTLYDSNTTFDFIRYVTEKRGGKGKAALQLISGRRSPFFVAAVVAGKLFKKDYVRELAVRLLKGIHKKEMQQLANSFYDEQLAHRGMQDVLALLKENRENDVWLFSNSLDPVIEAIASRLGVSYEATQLEYDGAGRFTGRISRDMSGRKKEVFLQRFGQDARIKMMCSDNKSDFGILQLARHPYVVVYDQHHKKYWQPLNPVFIEKF